METIKNHLTSNAGQAIIAAGMIVAVIVGGIFYTTKSATDNTLAVTGSAKMSVVADNVIWRSSITQNASTENLKTGYAAIAADLKLVNEFLKQSGVTEAEVTISPVTVMQNWNQNGGAPTSYTLRQTIEVNSKEVSKITDISKNIQKVIDQGAFFQTDSVEYYYSKLNEARVSLLTDATTDAKARAAAMAKSSHQTVGKLQSASSGVVQVLSEGAVDNGEYGQYDTSKINKDISVTVRATFKLK